jgi:serine-type D-Ala-D-Ala carboxypeptidase/endopeptidase (penicillin-binding protein 4)
MRCLQGQAILVACGLLMCAGPALAVDRTLGADVPKPTASGVPWTDREAAALAANLDVTLMGAPALRGAHVGIEAVDARDGRVLYERNQDAAFQPASTLKLLVGSVALEKLGPAFRFTTEALADGELRGGVLQGALVVRAGGDPFLRAADFEDLVTQLAQQGVHEIRDGVAFDLARYERPGYAPGWSWDDAPYAYQPVVGALAFEQNVLHLTVAPGALAAPATITSAPIDTLRSPNEPCGFSTAPLVVPAVVTGAAVAKDTLDLERTPFGCTRVVGTIPLGAKPETLDAAVPFPTVFAALALRDALRRHGIALGTVTTDPETALAERSAPANGTMLWTHRSAPLAEIVADMWLPSDNLVAEMLVRELGVGTPPAQGTLARGIALETAWLRGLGVDTGAITLVDGSGLSTYDRFTPHDLVAILAHDWQGPNRGLVLDDLPIAGVRGTLASIGATGELRGRVFAKTGTLSHVSTLAGYAATQQHGTVIFALMIDDAVADAGVLHAVRDRLLTQLVQS